MEMICDLVYFSSLEKPSPLQLPSFPTIATLNLSRPRIHNVKAFSTSTVAEHSGHIAMQCVIRLPVVLLVPLLERRRHECLLTIEGWIVRSRLDRVRSIAASSCFSSTWTLVVATVPVATAFSWRLVELSRTGSPRQALPFSHLLLELLALSCSSHPETVLSFPISFCDEKLGLFELSLRVHEDLTVSRSGSADLTLISFALLSCLLPLALVALHSTL